MTAAESFFLLSEMREAPEIIRRFNPASAATWAAEIASKGRLLVTGEGSSRIFPAKNMIALARQSGAPLQVFTAGAREAAEYKLEGFSVVALSNSGRTREVIGFCEGLMAPLYAITANTGSRLTEMTKNSITLSCGPERAVAASKSVVEQALVVQALLQGVDWGAKDKAADAAAAVLAEKLPQEMIDAVANARTVYFAGRDDGVGEELTLKMNEIARQKSDYLEGTYALHGIEEVMKPYETVVLIEPFAAEIAQYQKILSQGVGMRVIALASFDTPVPTFKLPRVQGFDGYIRLMAGWNVITSAALANEIDIDKPVRVRKVGNEIN